MNDRALATLTRSQKGPLAPAPPLDVAFRGVADAVAAWPGVTATVHWHRSDVTQVDGADFYYGEEELGHIHLDGEVHLATNPDLGAALVRDGLARPFPYARGWVFERISTIGAPAAIALFRRNYDRLVAGSSLATD